MDDLELNQLIKCRLCHQIYESPVLLPCNQTGNLYFKIKIYYRIILNISENLEN